MNPITHGLIGWTGAQAMGFSCRDRGLLTLASILPDLDGLGLPIEIISQGQLTWYSSWHHQVTHNLLASIIVTLILFPRAVSSWRAGAGIFLAFHLHLLCDLVGSKGPDGAPWPLHYFVPFASENAWPNLLLTLVLLARTLYLAWREGFSPLRCLSERVDTVFVTALRQRFGTPGSSLH